MKLLVEKLELVLPHYTKFTKSAVYKNCAQDTYNLLIIFKDTDKVMGDYELTPDVPGKFPRNLEDYNLIYNKLNEIHKGVLK